MAITAANIDQYRDEGATLVKGAFSQEWVERLTGSILDLWETFNRGEQPAPVVESASQNPPSMNGELYGGIELRNVAPCSAAMQRWIRESQAARYVAELTGASTVRFWMDSTFVKEPETGQDATPWHTDGSTYPFWGEQMPTMWLALTDVDENNAPLQTLAGSHKLPYRFHSGLSRQDVKLSGYRPWQALLDAVEGPGADIRVWSADQGDMLLMHPQMIHSSRPRSPAKPGRRIGLSTRWIGSDAVWKPDAYAASIPKLSQNPLMESGKAPPEAVFPIVYKADAPAAA
jgi:hypothetical protein